MTAAELLRELAERTRSAPEPLGTGAYHYVHTRGSHRRTKRFLSRSGDSVVTSSIEPFERRQWIAADGSGRIEVMKDGELVQPSGDYGPGELVLPFVDNVPGPGNTPSVIKAFREIWSTQVVPPSRQRLLLQSLAECADLSTDTAPRGFAGQVAVTHVDRARQVRNLLVFDQDTGELIGAESIELEQVISHVEWLITGYCETTAEPPRPPAVR
ncbi:hypothetical protein [Lentzea flava]|uniref:Uncharacterized protein n=1 Tax=Lentzea flava TaxID=103732 RepID=A0ABQ2UZL1_9PSEU|nr:hypothetical protein [Lentzea flava]MCP2202614.1 hypothetical protein [Lentzea flava]GGU59975.1 hypothetical protein GCM10010178_60190 [Lentzea flava]